MANTLPAPALSDTQAENHGHCHGATERFLHTTPHATTKQYLALSWREYWCIPENAGASAGIGLFQHSRRAARRHLMGILDRLPSFCRGLA